MQNKRIVVTGATGFVGSNVVKYFLERDFEIFIIVQKKSLLDNLGVAINQVSVFKYNQDIKELIIFFKEVNPSCVLHLASNFIAEHDSSQIDGLLKSNISFGLHILEAMKESGVTTIVNTGTSWQHYKNEKYNPVCLYAATKQAFEALLEYYVQAEGFKSITLKLFDTYGETDRRPKLINLLNKFADEQKVINMSRGEQILSLVHVEDVCSAFLVAYDRLIKYKKENKIINEVFVVNSNETLTLKEVISLFEEVSNKRINVNWGGREYRKREVMSLWDKGLRLAKWEPKISLSDGFKRIIN